jgi:hypothetical protein
LAVAVAATVIAAAPSLTGYLTEGQLRTGDCLTGSNLSLGTGNTWPNAVATTSCGRQHLAEVFFSGNAWPQSMTYPGYNAVTNQDWAHCLSAFSAYDGVDNSASRFSIYTIDAFPRSDWESGDGQLVCLAYQPGAPVDYSIRGSGR